MPSGACLAESLNFVLDRTAAPVIHVLLAGAELGCLGETLVIAAALNIQDPRDRPLAHAAAADGVDHLHVVQVGVLLAPAAARPKWACEGFHIL